jgi:hypothetical protein
MLKQPIFRDERLRRAMASAPCACCGLWHYSQCAHIGGLAQGKGAKLKVPDSHAAALCTVHPDPVAKRMVIGCHEKFDQHQINEESGWEFIAKTYIWLIEDGRLRVVA